MVYYVGILDGSGKVWGVRFPDVLGCVGGGKSPEEAIADAAPAEPASQTIGGLKPWPGETPAR